MNLEDKLPPPLLNHEEKPSKFLEQLGSDEMEELSQIRRLFMDLKLALAELTIQEETVRRTKNQLFKQLEEADKRQEKFKSKLSERLETTSWKIDTSGKVWGE